MILEGIISDLSRKAHLIDFRVGGRLVCIERSAGTSRLREGDHVRVSLQDDGSHLHVLAFQRSGEKAVCTGPQIGFSLAILSCLLTATGIATGLGFLLVPSVALLGLELLFGSDRRAVRESLRRV